MNSNHFIHRAAKILYQARQKQKRQLNQIESESEKFSKEIEQIDKLENVQKIFDHNAQEILKRIKKNANK